MNWYRQRGLYNLTKALEAFQSDVADKVRAFNGKEQGSSRKIKRFLIMTEPPSLDAGEITDKGYVNQRCVIDRRAELVQLLYTNPVSDNVVETWRTIATRQMRDRGL